MGTLAEAIEDHWSTWAPHGGPVVDRLLFGVDRADEVAAIVSAWCATNLGSPVAVGHRWMTSVGSVAVVDLADGRTVVVKVHQPDRDPRFLRAVQAVQRAVASAGIACPRPLAAPAPIGPTGSLAVADTLLVDPGLTDGRAPGAVVAAASTLADAIAAAEVGRRCRTAGPAPGAARAPLATPSLARLRLRGDRRRRRVDRRPGPARPRGA